MTMNWNAEWIWQRGAHDAENFYLLARKSVTLDRPPKEAKIFVTAGSLYKLYVNGTYVGGGRIRRIIPTTITMYMT